MTISGLWFWFRVAWVGPNLVRHLGRSYLGRTKSKSKAKNRHGPHTAAKSEISGYIYSKTLLQSFHDQRGCVICAYADVRVENSSFRHSRRFVCVSVPYVYAEFEAEIRSFRHIYICFCVCVYDIGVYASLRAKSRSCRCMCVCLSVLYVYLQNLELKMNLFDIYASVSVFMSMSYVYMHHFELKAGLLDVCVCVCLCYMCIWRMWSWK